MKRAVFRRLSVLIISALGFVAALAWHEAITSLFSRVFGVKNNLVSLFIYALFITILAVIVSLIIQKKSKR